MARPLTKEQYLEGSASGSKSCLVLGVLSRWQGVPSGAGLVPRAFAKNGARAKCDESKKMRQAGTNIVQQRKAGKLAAKASIATTLEGVAREFFGTKAGAHSA